VTLFAVAGFAAAALIATSLILRRLARRPQPAEDPAGLAVDRALRARSARSAIAASTALGLVLLSLVGESVYQGIHSYVCRPPMPALSSNLGNVYPWGAAVAPWLQDLSIGLLLAALVAWMICQRLPLPGQTERSVEG
jgi:hypothetical protein